MWQQLQFLFYAYFSRRFSKLEATLHDDSPGPDAIVKEAGIPILYVSERGTICARVCFVAESIHHWYHIYQGERNGMLCSDLDEVM